MYQNASNGVQTISTSPKRVFVKQNAYQNLHEKMSSVSQLSAGLRPSGHRHAHTPFLIIGIPPFLQGLGFTVQPNFSEKENDNKYVFTFTESDLSSLILIDLLFS